MAINWPEVFQTIGILTVAWLTLRTLYRHGDTVRRFTCRYFHPSDEN